MEAMSTEPVVTQDHSTPFTSTSVNNFNEEKTEKTDMNTIYVPIWSQLMQRLHTVITFVLLLHTTYIRTTITKP